MIRYLVASSFISCLPLLSAAAELAVKELERTDPVDFNEEIMPILKRNCLACHHAKEAEGGLNLETLAELRKGGDSGPGIVPKDATASSIFARASGQVDDIMPPEDNAVGAKTLTPQELGLLKLWIEQGAVGSASSKTESIQWQPIPDAIRSVYAIDVSPDGRHVAVARANRVEVLDVASGQSIARLVDPELSGEVAGRDLIQSIAYSPHGNRIAAGEFRTVRIWKRTPVIAADHPLASATGLIAISQDATTGAAVNAIGDIEWWDLQTGSVVRTFRGQGAKMTALVWMGKFLVGGDESGNVVVWSKADGQMAQHEVAIPILELAATNKSGDLAALGSDGVVRTLKFSSDDPKLTTTSDNVGGIADATSIRFVDANKPLLAVGRESGSATILSVPENKTTRTLNPRLCRSIDCG